MPSQIFFRGLGAIGVFVLVAAVAVTALAQAAPVRVVQGSDGTLYLAQEGKSWTLVPDPISDSELATLTSRGSTRTSSGVSDAIG